MASLQDLPDELVHQILHYVSPEETRLAIALVCKRLARVAQEPLLWKFYCEDNFRYWQPEHNFQGKRRAPAQQVDWKGLYVLRARRNRRITRLVNQVVGSRVSRLRHTEQICQYGYDAKDFLLTQCNIDDSAEDVLARRYYSCMVLDSIHRSLAIAEWSRYQRHAARHLPDDAPPAERLHCGMQLERALGAFDMFMLHDQEGDLDEICTLLDRLAAEFRDAHPTAQSMTTRRKAVALAHWLRDNNMTGLSGPEYTYRYLRNCLIGRALRDERHPSLPIISAAIYSSIASRLGMEAYCCALPKHVHAVVMSPEGMSLDDQPLPPDSKVDQEPLYLDPFESNEEVPLEDIHTFLARLGIPRSSHASLMCPTSTVAVVMRTAQNIRASFTSFRTIERPLSQLIPMIELNRGDWARNLQPALYSMIWASIMMVPILPDNEDSRWDWQQDVHDLRTYFKEYFPEDSWLVEKYVCPMYDTFAAPPGARRHQNAWGELPSRRVRQEIRDIRAADAATIAPRRRDQLPADVKVRYRVGQVFKHKRYDYHGIILGWTVEGAGSYEQQQGSSSSSSTSNGNYSQPFYRCMVGTDGSDHHVIAEESIDVVPDRYRGGGPEVLPPEIRDLMPMAGKFFKRWDGEKGAFVSNLAELYPDD